MTTFGELSAWDYFVVPNEADEESLNIYAKLPEGKAWKFRGFYRGVIVFVINDLSFSDYLAVCTVEVPTPR